jgi:aryl-phospho-beta-D-glucosidase BglC (GH1 family)
MFLIPVIGTASITLEAWASAPWNLTAGATSFSAQLTDADYEGGTVATFAFSTPLEGVDITDPASPDDSAAAASVFGLEATGFGVGEPNVGRFNRGESFVLQADHAFALSGINWGEYQGDESIHIAWTSAGIQQSQLIELEAGSFYTTTSFDALTVDANTPVVITNVSDSASGAEGRLRIHQVFVALTSELTLPEVGQTHRLSGWNSSPWNLVGGENTCSGSVTDAELGEVVVSLSDPLAGIDVSDPDLPDYSVASGSFFGVESTGFGVAEANVGRFERGESFVLRAERGFELKAIRWAEYSGDETILLTWTRDSIPMSCLVPFEAGSFYTEVALSGIYPDANTPLEIINVSDGSAYANGRLRVNAIDIAFRTDEVVPEDVPGAYMLLEAWTLWPWNAVGGATSFSGTLPALENGGTNVSFTFTAQSGVDITDPAAPDFSAASTAIFGFESTGFGVGESNVGRFDRTESVTLVCDHDYRIDTIVWRELSGDEQIHLSWTSAGVGHQQVFSLSEAATDFEDLIIDANTPLVITNVSPSTALANGRLRITDIKVRMIYPTTPYYDFSGSDGFVQMMGVNLSGAEFNGWALWQDNPQVWDYYHAKGLDLIRVPFLWERLQPVLYGAVDFSDLDVIVGLARERGMKVVLDMHNFDYYDGSLVGTAAVPNAAFADVWRKIAAHYSNDSAIYGYALMNEPHGTGGLWPASAQAATDAIREVDSSTWIIVSGENWSKVSSWRRDNPNLDVQDASGKIIYEGHVYFDSSWPAGDGSYGSYDSENPAVDSGLRLVHPFILWLQEKGARGFIGEYGVPKDDIRWMPLMDTFLSHINAYGLSSTYWSAGENWNNYALDCSPTQNYTVDSNQMKVLETYVK